MINWRIWHSIIVLGFLIGSTIVVYITFLWAYFYGNKVFAFTINSLGGADLELWVLTACMIISILWIVQYFRRRKKKT